MGKERHIHSFHPYILKNPALCNVFMTNEMSIIDFNRGLGPLMIMKVRKMILLIYGAKNSKLFLSDNDKSNV